MTKASEVIKALNGRTICTAESCTGGMIGAALTAVPGSSAVYKGGIISYWSEIKHTLLGVEEETLAKLGPVSAQVAEQMAKGAREALKADIAVSVTGSAGPDPDERGTPVGIVYIGLATPTGTFCRPLDLGKRRRDRIQDLATNHAFDVVRRYLSGLPVEKVTRRTSHS